MDRLRRHSQREVGVRKVSEAGAGENGARDGERGQKTGQGVDRKARDQQGKGWSREIEERKEKNGVIRDVERKRPRQRQRFRHPQKERLRQRQTDRHTFRQRWVGRERARQRDRQN